MSEFLNLTVKDIRAKSVSVGQAVALSMAAYDTSSIPAGFDYIDEVWHEKSGFYCRLFRQQSTGVIAIAWRGSDELLKDFITADALEIGLGRTVTQFQNFQRVWEALETHGITEGNFADRVIGTGHSLGAALEQGWHAWTRLNHRGVENYGITFGAPEAGASITNMYKFTADQFNAFKIYNIIDPHDPVPKFNNGGRLGVDVPLHYVSRLDDFDVTIAGEHLLTHYSDFIQQYYADPGDTMDKAFPYGVAKGNNWDEEKGYQLMKSPGFASTPRLMFTKAGTAGPSTFGQPDYQAGQQPLQYTFAPAPTRNSQESFAFDAGVTNDSGLPSALIGFGGRMYEGEVSYRI